MTKHIEFTVFDIETREARRMMTASRVELVDLQCEAGEAWTFGRFEPGTIVTDEMIAEAEQAAAAKAR